MDNHYQMLGITRNATAPEVKAAFQARMKALEASPVQGERRQTQEKLLQQAFLTLLDPARRARYDKQIDTPEPRALVRAPESRGVSVVTVVFVAALLSAVMAGGWYLKRSAEKRQEEARRQEDERVRAMRAKSQAITEQGLKSAEERAAQARADALRAQASKEAAERAARNSKALKQGRSNK